MNHDRDSTVAAMLTIVVLSLIFAIVLTACGGSGEDVVADEAPTASRPTQPNCASGGACA